MVPFFLVVVVVAGAIVHYLIEKPIMAMVERSIFDRQQFEGIV
jgi:peptidoglycan/LPS O-acetylase OafA/YrhL